MKKVLIIILIVGVVIGISAFAFSQKKKSMIKEILSFQGKPSSKNDGTFIELGDKNNTEDKLREQSYSELKKLLDNLRRM